MKINSNPFIQIDREYIISSAELRKALELKGEIEDIGLQSGRSPNDKMNNVSPEKDTWYIKTTERKKVKEELK